MELKSRSYILVMAAAADLFKVLIVWDDAQ